MLQVMGNSNPIPLSFVVKFEKHRDQLTLNSNNTIGDLKKEISNLSPEHPDPNSQFLIGLSKNVRDIFSDETLLSECNGISQGKKNMIQVIKRSTSVKSSSNIIYKSPPLSSFSSSPKEAVDKKLDHVIKILEDTLKSLTSYKSEIEKNNQVKYLTQLNEILMLELISMDSLELCNEDDTLREKRRKIIGQLQNVQDKVDEEIKVVKNSI